MYVKGVQRSSGRILPSWARKGGSPSMKQGHFDERQGVFNFCMMLVVMIYEFSPEGHLGAQNSGNSLWKILVFSAIFLENFYNFSVANNNVCNLDINNYYSVSTITKPIPIFTIFIFTVTLPNVLYLKSHTSKIVVTAITTLGHW
jgi:hypothetical protein